MIAEVVADSVPALQDIRYLTPHIRQVEKENAERAEWDNMEVKAVRKPLTA